MGFEEALHVALDTIIPLGKETIPLSQATGRTLAQTLISTIDSPSIDASLKDGYAVMSGDLASASPGTTVHLSLAETVAAAGGAQTRGLLPGTAMRILTGAEIPPGADAVLAEEFTDVSGKILVARNSAEQGHNIMPRGIDVEKGQCIAQKGDRIIPGLAGIIAASGFSEMIDLKGNTPLFRSLGQKGSLQSMAKATAIASIPEGTTGISQGTMTDIQVLSKLRCES